MENTFSTCRRAFRCKNQYEAFVTLNYVLQSVTDISSWQKKIETLQEAVFNHAIDFEKTSPDSLLYSGQLILKVIYASIHPQEFPAIEKKSLGWSHLADSWIQRRCKKESETLLPCKSYNTAKKI